MWAGAHYGVACLQLGNLSSLGVGVGVGVGVGMGGLSFLEGPCALRGQLWGEEIS